MGFFGRSEYAIKSWRASKKKFKATTGKKKPSEKFLVAFRKSSGVESAVDSVDQLRLKVWDAKSQKEYDKAKAKLLTGCAKLKKVVNAYALVLEKAAAGDYKAYKPAIDTLKQELFDLVNYLSTEMENRNGFS